MCGQTLVPASAAVSPDVPLVTGEGVRVEIFPNVGGGRAPTPADLEGLTPVGETLSPKVYFKRGSSSTGPGSLENFFAESTVLPGALRGLNVSNFTLRITGLLRVSADWDTHSSTAPIEATLILVSDGGCSLNLGNTVQTNVYARSPTELHLPVAFAAEGLYPVTLLFSGEANTSISLRFGRAWGTGTPTFDTDDWFPDATPALQEATFEEWSVGRRLADELLDRGVRFQTLHGDPQVTRAKPDEFVPVTRIRVYGDPSPEAAPGELELQFVEPGTTTPSTTSFVRFYLLNAGVEGTTAVTALAPDDTVLFHQTYHGGLAARERVTLAQPNIARVRITLGEGAHPAALDNLSFATPAGAPDLRVRDFVVPSPVTVHEPFEVRWTVENVGTRPADGRWTDFIEHAANPFLRRAYREASTTFHGVIPPGESVTRSAKVSVRTSYHGQRYFRVVVDLNDDLAETDERNNQLVLEAPVLVRAPDVAVEEVTAPAAADQGATITVTYRIRNVGDAAIPAGSQWTDEISLAPSANGVHGRLLWSGRMTLAEPLPVNGARTFSREVTLPLRSDVPPGDYFVSVRAASDWDRDPHSSNNASSAPLTLTQPPLPDLAVLGFSAPAEVTAGEPIELRWVVTNQTDHLAPGPWRERIALSADRHPGDDATVRTITIYDALPPHASVERTAKVRPPAAQAGQRWFVITTDSRDEVPEAGVPENNTRVAASATTVLAADLIVEDVVAPDAAFYGDTIPVAWTVRNAGTAPAQAAWREQVVLWNGDQPDVVFSRHSLRVVDRLRSLAPGESYRRTNEVTLPLRANYPDAALRIQVAADVPTHRQPEADEDNNAADSGPIALRVPRLPNLVVTDVRAPATADPGQTIPLIWTVANTGLGDATGPWQERVFVSDDTELGGDLSLAVFRIESPLAAGASLTRTQQVLVPVNGFWGEQWFVVRTDSARQLIEEDESDNTALSAQPTVVALALAVRMNRDAARETAGTNSVRALISRNGGLATNLVVTLTSSDPAQASVPATVTLPVNQSSVAVPVQVVKDHFVDGDHPVRITAEAAGFVGGSDWLTVLDADQPAVTLLMPETIEEGAVAVGRVHRNAATNEVLEVALWTDDPWRLRVDRTVVLAPGELETPFEFRSVENETFEGASRAFVYAVATNYPAASRKVRINDNETTAIELTLADTTLTESGPNSRTRATVTRAPVTSRGMMVTFSVEADGPLVHPRRLLIPPNQASASFTLSVRDDSLVNGTRAAVLTAYAVNDLSLPVPDIRSDVAVEVLDDDGPTLGLTVRPATISESGQATGTVSRNTDAVGDLEVALASSNPREATVPATVVIPDGRRSVTFPVQGQTDGVSDGPQEVVISATADGWSDGLAHLVVSDVDLPDLEVSDVSGPTNALTDGEITVRFTVANHGLAAAEGPWRDAVYIAAHPGGAPDELAAISRFNGALAVGESYERTLSVPLPSRPGRYWICVKTDAERALTEGTRRNNLGCAALPLVVQPAYQAVAWTDVDAAPNGTPIPIQGRAWMTADTNAPAASLPVEVSLRVRRTKRTLTAWTDADGNFSTVFQPLPTEAGIYTLGAQYPGDVESDQDQFILLGMKATRRNLALRLVPGEPLSGEFKLRNLSELPLTGLTADLPDAPDGVTAVFDLPETLLGDDEALVRYTLTAAGDAAFKARVRFHFASAEGATTDLPIQLTVLPLRPALTANPPYLDRGMVRGRQTLVSFTVTNGGGAPSGPLTVLLPSLPWLSLASPDTLPSLAPGERATVTLRLHPADDLPLARYDGTLAVAGANAGLNVRFRLRALSTGRGDLRVAVKDQYTYYVEGAPLVTNALVTLSDAFTGEIVAETDTGDTGETLLTDLREGSYRIEIFAPRHAAYHGVATIEAGATTELTPFLSRETVTYRWRVVPTEIEDHYRIVLESEFESEVPAPNLVIETPLLTPLVFPGVETQTEVVLRNDGLIALHDVHFKIPDDPAYLITPLVEEIGTMPAKSRFVVPVTIRHRNIPLRPEGVALAGRDEPRGNVGVAGGDGGCDDISPHDCVPKIPLPVIGYYVCGPDNQLQYQVADFRPLCTDYKAYKCLKGLKDAYKNLTNPGSAACDFLAAIADCIKDDISPCITAPLKAACKAAMGDPGGGGLDGLKDLLKCLCKHMPDFSITAEIDSVTPLESDGPPGGGSVSMSPAWYPGGAPGEDCGSSGAARHARALAGEGAGSHPPGVCAQVRMRIEQKAVMTRAAFLGTLEISNTGAETLTGLRVDLEILDEQDQPANERFAQRPPRLTGLSDLDGNGELSSGRQAVARFTFIPTRDAAPEAPTVYSIGGTLRYVEGGEEVVVPLATAPIIVLPEARLALDYFQQRDVYADDPFTDEVEPSEPFALGLIAKNLGAGWARNFRITSAQPQIVENEKGLLIDFKIIGSQVGGEEVAPSLTVNLGNIAPGASQVAAWWLTSSLQGKFLDYTATFEHVDSLGYTNLSLIDSVRIHELIHVVRANRPDDDDLPDFLVNDDADPQHLPDTLYFSDGTLAAVNLAVNPSIDRPAQPGHFAVQLTADMTTGWNYLELPDPGARFRLLQVVRSDGRELRVGDNVWQTDRTFPSSLHGAVREWTLHLLDFNGPGRYTLTYEVNDTEPPRFAEVVPPDPLLQPGPVPEVDVIFSEPIDLASFGPEDLALTLNGGPNLIDAGVGVLEVGQNIYRITGLTALTGGDGNYELTILGGGITDFGGNPVNGSARVTWAKAGDEPVAFRLGPVTPNPRRLPLDSLDVEFSRALDPATLTPADFVLTRDGGENLLTDAATVTALSGTVFRLGGLAPFTGADGAYALTLRTTGVTDTQGHAGVGLLTTRWTMDGLGPGIVALEEITTNPRNIVVPKLDVTFSEPIAPESFDWQDLELSRDGGPNLITGEVTVTPLDAVTFRVANFNWVVGQEGEYVFRVAASGVTDLAGNPGEGEAVRVWTMDLTPPAAPFDLRLTPAPGAGDRVNTNRLVLAGQVADAGVTVRVKDLASQRDLGATTPDGGHFSLPLELSSEGSHPLAVRAVDAAGNVSEKVRLDLFVDTTGPRVTLAPVSPNRRLTGVPAIEAHFSEPIAPDSLGLDDFTLTRNGAPVPLAPDTVRIEARGAQDYALNGLGGLTEPVGEYVLTVRGAGVLDPAGNRGRNQSLVTWERVSANTAPRLPAVSDQVVPEEETFSLTFTAEDDDLPADTLLFTLEGDVPPGAQLTPASGRFTWRPAETQGPGEYDLRVKVTDNGVPPMSDTKTFHITVREVNRPPVITPAPRQRLIEDEPLDLALQADDPDEPANLLSWRLLSPFPAGLTLDAATGRLQWAPTPDQWGFTNRLAIVVSDDGHPALSTTSQVEVVTVALKPGLNRPRRASDGGWEFTFKGQPGVQYRLETSDDLKTWRNLFEFTVPTRLAPVRDPDAESHPLRFYRARRQPSGE